MDQLKLPHPSVDALQLRCYPTGGDTRIAGAPLASERLPQQTFVRATEWHPTIGNSIILSLILRAPMIKLDSAAHLRLESLAHFTTCVSLMQNPEDAEYTKKAFRSVLALDARATLPRCLRTGIPSQERPLIASPDRGCLICTARKLQMLPAQV